MLRPAILGLVLALAGCTISLGSGGSDGGSVDGAADHSAVSPPDGSRHDAPVDAPLHADAAAHDTGVDGSEPHDAGSPDAHMTDGAVDGGGVHDAAAEVGFTVAVSPPHITEDPGDSFPVTVTIDRTGGFTDALTITVNNLPTGASATPLTIPGSASSGMFSLAVASGTTVTNTEIELSVVAANGTGSVSGMTPLGFRFGSKLILDDAGVYLVPSYSSGVTIKAWGGGGGGGGINGAPGGSLR